MQNLGRFAVQQYVNTGIDLTTGVGYEFIRIINNSPYFLSLNFVGQGQVDFPECYLEDIAITRAYRGQLIISFTANLSNIAQAPSFLLSVNGYNPGEVASPQAQPLTFVSNVGNTVSTNALSNILSNEVSALGAEIVDVGTLNNSRLFNLFNDHFAWFVEQMTIKHQVLKGQTTGNPLLIGQSGDTSEVLGNFLIDGTTKLDGGQITTDGFGHITLNNDTSFGARDSGGTARGIVLIDTNDRTILEGNGGPGGNHGQVMIASDTTNIMSFGPGTTGPALLSGSLSLLTGSISRIAHNLAVACINGKTTVVHGLGAVPDIVLITINASAAPGAIAAGYNPATLSSTQVDIWANGNFNVDVTTVKF